MTADLPIQTVLPELRAALRERRGVVLQAPPGAGKSTLVPLALLEEPWLRGRRILMLEPRRLAARAVAERMAHTLGEEVGRTVGYRMRLDTRVSGATRIEVVTEGVLAVLLQRDAALDGVGCVVFDEFHERSLHADLGLALCIDVQANLSEELRLLVMSATLAAEPVARLLGAAPIISAEGRSFPVEIRYRASGAVRERTAVVDPYANSRAVAETALRAVREETGDVLAFLPGTGEIRQALRVLEQADLGSGVRLLPLSGDLTREQQALALEPSRPGERKIVLATNIAETSLTIPGVRIVVDGGLARRARFDPVSGMSRLETVRLSRASAEQRCGRAGRLGPGMCYRLWTEGMQHSLEAHTPAEILEADLAPLALDLAGWNVNDPQQLRWLDLPPAAAYAQARQLLQRLRALGDDGRITAHGREMLELRLHPRLAHLLLRSRAMKLTSLACDLAALLGERDFLRARAGQRDADVRVRLELMRGYAAEGEIDRTALERVRKTAQQYRRQLNVERETNSVDEAGVLLALAYPDRIARARAADSGRYRLANGRGAFFAEPQSLARAEFLAVAELDGGEREARIFLAAPLERSALERMFAEEIRHSETVRWDAKQQAVVASREKILGDLVIEDAVQPRPDPEAVRKALLEGIRAMSLAALPWDAATREWQARVQFVRAVEGSRPDSLPEVSDAALAGSLEDWLGPWLHGITRRDDLGRLDLRAALEALLDWNQRQRLDASAPSYVIVPSGSRIPVSYLESGTPSFSVRLQEVFGMHATPCVGGGKVPLLVKLLSPARRPVQVTRDLASFWRGGYQEVRKELKGRYPRHYWPEDPLQAEPIRGSRKPRLN